MLFIVFQSPVTYTKCLQNTNFPQGDIYFYSHHSIKKKVKKEPTIFMKLSVNYYN